MRAAPDWRQQYPLLAGGAFDPREATFNRTAANDLVLEPKTLVDLEGRFDLTEGLRLSLGADNVFDEYPTQSPPTLNTTSNTPFPNYSPFGRAGRFVYGRIAYDW
jgi:iron complex outermembrane receptor protein